MTDLLVEARNRSLVKGESHAGVMYIWSVRPQVGEVSGRTGRDLDQYMLRLNLQLIAANPASYVGAVTAAAGSYVLLASPEDADFGVRPLKLLWMAVHFALALVFVAQACVVAGLAVLRRIPAQVLWPLVFGYTLLVYNLAVSTMFEVGNPRYRVPTDAVAMLLLLVGLSLWSEARAEMRADPRSRAVWGSATALRSQLRSVALGRVREQPAGAPASVGDWLHGGTSAVPED